MKMLKFVVIFYISVIGISCTNKSYALSSPESVIQNFVLNIKNGNIDAAINLSPFIVDNFVNKINPKEEILYMNSILPQDNLVTTIDLIKKYNLLSFYAIQIRCFISSILLPEEFSGYSSYSNGVPINGDENKIDRFISSFNLKNLTSLELVRFDIVSQEVQFSERGRRNIENQKKIYGFDEKVEYTVLYKHNGKYYAGAMTLVKYGNNWYILNLHSNLANWSSSGGLEIVSGEIDYLVKFGLK